MQPFESARLAYRPITLDDVEAAFAIFGDAAAMTFSPFGVHPDIGRTTALLQRQMAHHEKHGFGFWAVDERTSGDFIGICGLEIDADSGDAEIAYRFRRDRWGQGYASEATAAWVTKGFGERAFERITAIVEPAHAASIRVLEKLGMRIERRTTLHEKPVLIMVLEKSED